jgi:hypothetical protein
VDSSTVMRDGETVVVQEATLQEPRTHHIC